MKRWRGFAFVLGLLQALTLLPSQRGVADPGDYIWSVRTDVRPTDIALDARDGTLWVANGSLLHHFDHSLKRRVGDPVPLSGLIYGLAFNSVDDTLLVLFGTASTPSRILELTRSGDTTGRSFDLPAGERPFQGMAFDPTGDDGQGSFYVLEFTFNRGNRPLSIYEFALDGRVLRVLPDPPSRDGFPGSITDIDIIYDRQGKLIGFYVVHRTDGCSEAVRLDPGGNVIGPSFPLGITGVQCILRGSLPDPRTGEIIDAFVCGATRGGTLGGVLALLEGGEPAADRFLGCEETEPCAVAGNVGEVLNSIEIEDVRPVDMTTDGEILIVATLKGELLLYNLELELVRRKRISESLVGFNDEIGGVAWDGKPQTVLVYNVTQRLLGKCDFEGVLVDLIAPLLVEDPISMTFDRLGDGGLGSLLVARQCGFISEFDGSGRLFQEIPHPFAHVQFPHPDVSRNPFPLDQGIGCPALGGISLAAEDGSRELLVSSSNFGEGDALGRPHMQRLSRLNLETKEFVPGTHIPTSGLRGTHFVPVEVLDAGRSRLFVLGLQFRAFNGILELSLDLAPLPPPSHLFCLQEESASNNVRLDVAGAVPYELVEVFRDCRKIAEVPLAKGEDFHFVDREAPPDIHEYAVRGRRGELVTEPVRRGLRVGPGAVLQREFSYPAVPEAIAHDPADDSYYVVDSRVRTPHLYHFDASFRLLEVKEDVIPENSRPFGVAVRVEQGGRRFVYILSQTLAGNTLRKRALDGSSVESFLVDSDSGEDWNARGLSWDPGSDTFWTVDRTSRAIVELSLDGRIVRRIVPQGTFDRVLADSLALAAVPGRGTLLVTAGSSPPSMLAEMDVTGRPTGRVVPVEGLTLSGMTVVRDEIVAVSYPPDRRSGDFLRLIAFTDDGKAIFIRGNTNADGAVNLADAQYLLNFLFLGGPKPSCPDATDVNDDSQANIADAQYLLNHLFLGGPAPPEPFPDPGSDPTEDQLAPCL